MPEIIIDREIEKYSPETMIDGEIEKCLPAVHPTNRLVQTKLLALLLQMIKYDTRSVFE